MTLRRVTKRVMAGMAVLILAALPAQAERFTARAAASSPTSRTNQGNTEASPNPVEVFETSDHARLARIQARIPAQGAADTGGTQPTIFINDSLRYQPFQGVGVAMTNASAYLLGKLPPALSRLIVYDMFSRNASGAGFVRVPIGASDFNQGGQIYTNDDMPPGQTDFDLRHFTFAHDKEVIKFTSMAQHFNPALKVMAMPWSMPAWMKTSGSLLNWNGYIDGQLHRSGGLIPGYEKVYARYLAKWTLGMFHRGVRVDILGIENEPGVQNNSYPASDLSIGQEVSVINYLRPMLRAYHLATKVYVYDGGWKRTDTIQQLLQQSNAPGALVHCYGGSPIGLTPLHYQFRTKDIILSECALQDVDGEPAAQLMIEVMRNWVSGGLTWNFVLNDAGLPKTPHDANCGGCRGTDTVHLPAAADVAAGLVTRSPNPSLVGYSREMYDLESFGHFVEPGAVRVFSTHNVSYSVDSLQESAGVDNVVFHNPRARTALGNKDVMVSYNNTHVSQTITVRDGSLTFSFVAAPRATDVAVITR
jgi:glucosylceramidase